MRVRPGNRRNTLHEMPATAALRQETSRIPDAPSNRRWICRAIAGNPSGNRTASRAIAKSAREFSCRRSIAPRRRSRPRSRLRSRHASSPPRSAPARSKRCPRPGMSRTRSPHHLPGRDRPRDVRQVVQRGRADRQMQPPSTVASATSSRGSSDDASSAPPA